jgi:prepilin-type N-terminal cleavage/methylation domain-containing protein
VGIMKILRNQKGLTLVELLATIVILATVMGTATMLLSSVYYQWNSSSQKFSDDHKRTLTIDILTKNMTMFTKIIKVNNKEIRFKSEDAYKALILNNNNELTIYTFTSGSITEDAKHFGNPFINITSNPSFFTDPLVITDNLQSLDIQYWDGNSYISFPSSVLENGEIIKLTLVFTNSKVNIWGIKTPVLKTETNTFKLLLDY